MFSIALLRPRVSRAQLPVQQRLAQADGCIAELGAILARDEPVVARRLVREVQAELPLWLRFAGARRRACAARARLLDPARVAGDLAREDTQSIDGWWLARSEAAAAVYLHAIQSGHARV